MYSENSYWNKYLYFEYNYKFEGFMIKAPQGSHLGDSETGTLWSAKWLDVS